MKLLALAVIAGLPGLASAQTQGCFPYVKQLAESLAGKDYAKPAPLQMDTGRITYDFYQKIKFRPETTFWRKENLPFQLEFMHPGMHYIQPIELYIWDADQPHPIAFSMNYYNYDEVKFLHLEQDKNRMGFVGLRILFPLGGKDTPHTETLVFQGASYFRGLARDQRYGLSTRGLTINASLENQEEFPDYTRFWLEKPTPDAAQLVFCALLDSPSTSGASRFVLTPDGKTTRLEVETQLYPRKAIPEVGVAPLTSMFFHGENSLHQYGDYRPEVHDSDGLLIHAGDDWQWQPLVNPDFFNVQSIPLKQLTGFGLMQRDRDFASYQDLGAWYQARPSVWVEPLEDWGAGKLQLLSMPTQSDILDNTVAYWVSDQGRAFSHLHYNLYWRSDDPPQDTLGKVHATRIANRAADAMPDVKGHVRFFVDFTGVPHADETPRAEVQLLSKGEISSTVVQENPYIKGWRVMTQIEPENCGDPVNINLRLTDGGNPLTEQWSYRSVVTLCTTP